MSNSQKHSLKPLEPRHVSQERRRGVILTSQALKKLQKAKLESEISDNNGIAYTLEALSVRTGLDPHTLIKIFTCERRVDRRTLSRCFQAFNLSLEPNDYSYPALLGEKLKKQEATSKQNHQETIQNRQYWDMAPDISIFFGREAELATLKRWIQSDQCRLVILLGMGGIGKTWLATKLATLMKDEFDFVIWRSLRNAPPIQDFLAESIQFLSKEQATYLPETIDRRISLLISYLQTSRCLLVLDNFEKILQNCTQQQDLCYLVAGRYRQDYENYGQFLRLVGQTAHQSCLLLTSREKPQGIGQLEGERLPVRLLKLKGLQITEAQKILAQKGVVKDSKTEYKNLIDYYAGNPLILKIVSTTIKNLFDGNIAEFLKHKTAIFGEIAILLAQQFERLSIDEQELMTCLAVPEKPVSISYLRSQIQSKMSAKIVLEMLESLSARSLISQSDGCFYLEPILRDYVKIFLDSAL